MVKSYLRYEPLAAFGVICSGKGNICYDKTGKAALVPALEQIILWDLKKGQETARWKEIDNKAEVTCLAWSPNGEDFAAGYADGTIRLWNAKVAASTVTLSGHRGAVSALAYNNKGTLLASGANDTDLIVWDVVAETGVYRLKGHKDQITCLRFISQPSTSMDIDGAEKEYLLSASKDTLLKIWDLTSQFCRETLVGHRSEIWSFDTLDINDKETVILSGGSEAGLRAWKINWEILRKSVEELETKPSENPDEAATIVKAVEPFGTIQRHSRDRIVTVKFHASGLLAGVQTAERVVELYQVRDAEQIQKKIQRRRKRAKEKGKDESEVRDTVDATDLISSYTIVRPSYNARSFDFSPKADIEKQGHVELVVSLGNNSIESYTAPLPPKSKKDGEIPPPTQHFSVDLQGHRTDIRALALSSDDEMLASVSSHLLKVWNVRTRSCIRSMETGYALCCAFVPGNRYILVGTKEGTLDLYDIGSSSMVKSVRAHSGAVYSLNIRPDKRGFVTGSADKDVKFWDFDMDRKIPNQITFAHMRTLKMSDEVLCVRYSPNQELLAVSLLDTTVKVFYHDTLKFFLSLYGHKLPVLSMDISSDNTLIATSSADKNVKLWGLDFGDCHKSIFAHQESVTSVQFVWNTHYFFTTGKDRMVKYWDGDKFENIMKLEGHHGEVWGLAVAKQGAFVVTGSQDHSLRIWERTDEQLFLEEEREKELEELYESTLVNQMEKVDVNGMEVDSAGKQTMETLKAGERIMEALDIADQEREAWAAYENAKAKNLPAEAPPRNPYLLAMGDISPERYVLQTIEKIKANDLEEALLVLPFSKVQALLAYVEIWAKKNMNIVLVSRILFSLIKTHHNQIVTNRLMRPMLDSIRHHLRAQLQRQKDIMGYNRAALTYLHRDWKARNTADFFDEAPSEAADEKKRKFIQLSA
ncbi:WD40-repeat-containing domain protein [Syncephalastrum racemosum]|uniref:WD40-repeat-containing domain protein n=1 Tax=Syncephalastrum racemosum TaxID=13706 RepID=A0A1X2HQB2_SYNRA|nr:WD40-repeat-containing domain protein [Syncephalastrum racemosum]